MEAAVKSKELHPRVVAYAIDMIAVLENRPQIYGTQFETVNGEKKYYPISNAADINKRRRSVGLGIFEKNYDTYDTVIIGKQFRD